MARSMRKKNDSAIWVKTEDYGGPTPGFIDNLTYEVLVPGMKERDVVICKDLGYHCRSADNMSKSTRRQDYSRLEESRRIKQTIN